MKDTKATKPVCDLPPPSQEEVAALREHVRRHGVLDPVHVDEAGNVIDGLARVRIAGELGVPCPQKVHTGLTDEEKRALRRALNLARRHLSSQQKRDLIEAQLRDTPGWSNRRVAQALGVSHPTVAAVRKSLASTGKVTTPARTEGRDGRSRPASRADQQPAPERPAGEAARLTPASVASETPSSRTRLILGACPDALAQIPDSSVDLAFSDPPYPEISRSYGRLSEGEWLDLMKATALECSRVLKPTGSMVFILEPNSARAGRMRTWHMEFTLWAAKEFGLVQDAYCFNTCPMPGSRKGLLRSAIKWSVWLGGPNCYRDQDKVLKERYVPNRKRGDDRRSGPSGRPRRMDRMYETAARRGGATPFNVIEVATSTGSPGSEDHPAKTPLPVADWWCRYLLPSGGVLLDPFVGSGTMLVAGLSNGASRVIGIDKEEEYLAICRRRLGLCKPA